MDAKNSFKIYKEGDPTEDYYMLDKGIAEKVGLKEVMEAIAFGQGRYGERIFDQQSNLYMKKVMNSKIPAAEKAKKIGKHIYRELKTHSDFSGSKNYTARFNEGDEVNPMNPYLTTSSSANSIIAAKRLYNEWARITGKPQLREDETMDDSIMTAIKSYNASNPLRKINVTSTPIYGYGENNNTSELIHRFGLNQFLPELKEIGPITGFDKNGRAIRGNVSPGQAPPTIQFPVGLNNERAVTNPNPNTSKTEAGWSQAQKDAFVDTAINTVTGVTGAIMAGTNIPSWRPQDEYYQMRDDIYSRRNQGLTAEEWASINQSLDRTYANGISQVRNIVGGGVGQGTAIAALAQLSSVRDRGALQAALADVSQRANNNQIYRNAVMTDVEIDKLMSAPKIQAEMQTRQAGLAMVAQSAQNLYDQRLYRQNYGPNSFYQKYMDAQLEDIERQRSIREAQAAAYKRSLK